MRHMVLRALPSRSRICISHSKSICCSLGALCPDSREGRLSHKCTAETRDTREIWGGARGAGRTTEYSINIHNMFVQREARDYGPYY